MTIKFHCRRCRTDFEPLAGLLQCACRTVDIVNDIPRFTGNFNYASAFGDQWNRFRKTQLDSFSGSPISMHRLQSCLSPVELKDLKGKTVLEVGCGAGRFTEIMISSGATVWSLDLSNAVDANALNCPVTPSHVILQADASDIPLRHNFFDFVICVGVLQHTEYPGRVVDELIRVTKPGGFICIDHYRLTFSFVTRLLPIYRFLLKLLPIKDTLKTAKVLVALLLPIHKFLGGTVFGYALLSRVSPIVSYYHRFPELSEGSQNEWATLDTHDSLFDRFKKLHTTRSLRQFLERRGADIIKLEKAGIGFEVILRKAEYR